MDTPQLDPIYRKVQRAVFLQALKMLRDEELALDVVQEAFVRVLRHLDKLDEKQDPVGWIRRIVTNLCLDELRKRRTNIMVDGVPVADFAAPSNSEFAPLRAYENQELRDLLRESLGTLSPEHLKLFLMRETEGMTYAEMAAEVQCPTGTVMSRLFHARKKLQKYLQRGMHVGDLQRRTRAARVHASAYSVRPKRPVGEPELMPC